MLYHARRSPTRRFSFTEISQSPYYDLFVVFKRGVVQFYNDDLSDLYGNYNEVAENVFAKLLKLQINDFSCSASTAVE